MKAVRSLAAFTLVSALSAAAAADEPDGESCSVITLEANGAPKTTPVEGLKVLEQTKKDGAFSLPRRAPRGVQAVICKRPTVVPAANDYKVLQAGFTLYLTDDLARMAALGLVDGRVQLDLLDGALTATERTLADERLRAYPVMRGGARP
jgi:hypothetical protein